MTMNNLPPSCDYCGAVVTQRTRIGAELDRVSAENARLRKALKEIIATAERVGKPTHPSYSGMLTGQAWRDGQKTAWQGVMVTASAALPQKGEPV